MYTNNILEGDLVIETMELVLFSYYSNGDI